MIVEILLAISVSVVYIYMYMHIYIHICVLSICKLLTFFSVTCVVNIFLGSHCLKPLLK
jgi:hypothetical protein